MNNINKSYIEEYIRSILPANSEKFKKLEEYARENRVPIIEPEVAQFLKVQLKIKNPKNILELGTAIGYSALIMAEATENSFITSIERRKDMIYLAEKNIGKTKYKDRIRILQGDAEKILPSLTEEYDFIFLDAAKGQYMKFFNQSIRILKPGGVIVSDNVLFRGMVARDELVVKRQKTIVKRLREFLEHINKIDGYISSVIPIGDGLAITYREE